MLGFIANIFGYLLNFIYELFNNYGISIIIFSILVKLILLPLTIKQQKTMEKNSQMQDEIKEIQSKYKNNQELLNKELMDMYKRENMNPFSGCLSSIIQLILILAVFYLVRSPLTYMKKIDNNLINEYSQKIETTTNYPEVQIIKEFGNEDDRIYLNMNFLQLDLSSVPSSNLKDIKTLIIPFLYVISSIISTKITMKNQDKLINKKENEENGDNKDNKESMEDMMMGTTKSMSYMMPFMAFSISLVAPLGLALYWLMSNILMIIEKILIDKIILKKEEKA